MPPAKILRSKFGYQLLRVPADYGTFETEAHMSRSGLLKNKIQRSLRSKGFALRRPYPQDFSEDLVDIIERVSGYTTSTRERIEALHAAVNYVLKKNMDGAIVETGVWRGGSMMVAALTMLLMGDPSREIWLYDTFSGMPVPDSVDKNSGSGAPAMGEWLDSQQGDVNLWRLATEDQVTMSLESTGYPGEKLHLVKGLVEETIPGRMPESIALLRIDTDWYAPTRHALEHLYPKLQPGGILILDDYGSWDGARKAVDEYFDGSVYLHRIDYTARCIVKPL